LSLLPDRRRDPTKALLTAVIAGFWPLRLKQDRSARIVIAGHAFVQNVRRGHYELAAEEPVTRRLVVAFDELALAI
jgi:hypothetical protein